MIKVARSLKVKSLREVLIFLILKKGHRDQENVIVILKNINNIFKRTPMSKKAVFILIISAWQKVINLDFLNSTPLFLLKIIDLTVSLTFKDQPKS